MHRGPDPASPPTLDAVSVPIPCPNCGTEHLHATFYMEADGDRFQVVAEGPEADTVLVRFDPDGAITPPEAVVSRHDGSVSRAVRS